MNRYYPQQRTKSIMHCEYIEMNNYINERLLCHSDRNLIICIRNERSLYIPKYILTYLFQLVASTGQKTSCLVWKLSKG